MFAVCVEFEIEPARMEQFLPLMHQQAVNSLEREAGCLRFDVLTDPARPNLVFLYEIYADAAAFDVHLQSEHFHTFDGEVAPMVTGKSVRTYSTIFADSN